MDDKILFKNFKLVRGDGSEVKRGDIEVKGDTIYRVGKIEVDSSHSRVYEGGDQFLTPGFIDIHSHSDLLNFVNNGLKPKLKQGVTTETAGLCGIGPAPIQKKIREDWRKYFFLRDPLDRWKWETVEDFFAALKKTGLENNFMYFLPHGLLRYCIKGEDPDSMDESELKTLKEVSERAISQGCRGLSLGLNYFPAKFSSGRELEVVCREAARYDLPISVHLRSEGDAIIKSLREIDDIRKNIGNKCKMHISHLKIIGSKNATKIEKVLEFIDSRDFTFDCYPYIFGYTTLDTLLPPGIAAEDADKILNDQKTLQDLKLIYEEGDIEEKYCWDNLPYLLGWNNIIIVSLNGNNNDMCGSSIQKIASQKNTPPHKMVIKLLRDYNNIIIKDYYMKAEHIKKIISNSNSCIATDALFNRTKMHYRTKNTFPWVLKQNVFESEIMKIEEAINKFTGFPAEIMGLKDRGLLKEGYKADLTLFTRSDIISEQHSNIRGVMVNGDWKIKNSEYLEGKPGKVLS